MTCVLGVVATLDGVASDIEQGSSQSSNVGGSAFWTEGTASAKALR